MMAFVASWSTMLSLTKWIEQEDTTILKLSSNIHMGRGWPVLDIFKSN